MEHDIYYSSYKNAPKNSILSQLNPVHMLTNNLLNIHFNINLISTPTSQKWSLSSSFAGFHLLCVHAPTVFFALISLPN
jgi:hypothetical protein